MNRVEIRGGLTRDPEFRYVGQAGTPLAEFTVAVNGTRYDSGQRQQVVKTTFVSVNLWGLKAEEMMQAYPNLGKGDEVYVLGELDQHEIEKTDGSKERKTRVTALLIDVLRCRNYQHPHQRATGPHTGPQQQHPAPTDEPPF